MVTLTKDKPVYAPIEDIPFPPGSTAAGADEPTSDLAVKPKPAKKKREKITLTKEDKKAIRRRIAEIDGVYNEPSTQNAIPYSEMTPDGICVVPKSYFSGTKSKLNDVLSKLLATNNKANFPVTQGGDYYSKTLTFGDVNYQLASKDDQDNIFAAYSAILNYFNDSVNFQLTFENRRRDLEKLERKIDFPAQDEQFNDICGELSGVIKSKLTEGDNGNEFVKFLTFGVFAKNITEARRKLNPLAQEIIGLFESAKVEARVLSGKERLAVLYRALNPNRRNRFIFDWKYMKKIGSNTKDYIAPSSMKFNKQNFELGDCHGSVMTVNLIATEISDRILQDILGKTELFCVNLHVQPIDILTGKKLVDDKLSALQVLRNKKQDKLISQGKNPDSIPLHLQEKIEDMSELREDVKSGGERIFQVSITIRTYSKSEKAMRQQCDLLRRICQNHGNILIPCDYQQEDGLCATLPLGVTKTANKRGLHTSSLAAFIPFVTKRIFHIDSPNAIYYGLNALTRDMIYADKGKLQNPNSLILGMPGSGKSFAAKYEIALAFLKTKCDIFICDPENEYHPLVNKLKGQVITLSSTSGNYLNPMDIVFDSKVVADENPIPDKINFLVSFMEIIIGGNGLTAQERTLIDRAAKKIYEDFIFNVNFPPTAETMPTLGDLHKELETYGEPAHELTCALEMYVHGSQNYFNNRTNVDINNRLVCFDINRLGDILKKPAMLIVQETVWNRVRKNKSLKRTTRFYIDEFHLLLKDVQTAKYAVEFYKRFRKYYGIPCGITQNVKDFLDSPEIESIFENTAFAYLLNQASHDREILMEKFEISEACAKYINNSKRGTGVLKFGKVIIPFENELPKNLKLYELLNTQPESEKLTAMIDERANNGA